MWVCPDCDALQREVVLKPGATAHCWRCAAVLRRPVPHALDRTLALTLAAAVVFVIASAFPLVSLDMQGQTNSTSLWGAVATLWQQDARLLAVLVFTTTQALPAAELAALIWLLAPLVRRRRPAGGAWLLRALVAVRPWGMVEVFVLGVLVALVKMTSIATVVPGVALWAFGALIVLFASAVATFDPHAAWQRLATLTSPVAASQTPVVAAQGPLGGPSGATPGPAEPDAPRALDGRRWSRGAREGL